MLGIFRFDLMFVKPRDVFPMFRFNMQTDTRFLSQKLLFPEGRCCKNMVSGAAVTKLLC